MVENQARGPRVGETRAEETKRGSPSGGSASSPVARAAIAPRYSVHARTNFAVSTTWIDVTTKNAAVNAQTAGLSGNNRMRRSLASGWKAKSWSGMADRLAN